MTYCSSLPHPSHLLLLLALATSSTWADSSDAQAKGVQAGTTTPLSALAQVGTSVDQGVKTSEAKLAKPAQSAPPAKTAFKGDEETTDPLLIALAGLAVAVAIVQRRSKRS